MPLTQLDKESSTPDLTSQVTVLTHTPSGTLNILCQAFIEFTGLDGSGGNFELTITVGGATIQPDPQIVNFSTDVNSSVFTLPFMVPANMEVIIKAKSPNAGDSAGVTVDAYLYDVYDQTDVAAILTDTGTTLDTLIKDIPTVAEFEARTIPAADYLIVADITGAEVDNDGTAISLAGALKLMLSVLTGKSSGGGGATIVFRDIADTKNRISATVDANGNRTAVGTRDGA